MSKTLKDILESYPPERRAKIEARAEELIRSAAAQVMAEEVGFRALAPEERFESFLQELEERGLVPHPYLNIRPEVQVLQEIDNLRTELQRKNAQILEALSILEHGTDYEKIHVRAILTEALDD